MITGVLLVLIAILIFIKPSIVTAIIGIFIGACLLVCGAWQIVFAIRR
jgi:uncharacterized membrane protein HdeD (DUF308 family)